MFELFGKLDERENKEQVNVEGLGMGLFICKKIIDNTGGAIDCFSAGEGLGTTFMFSMHMREAVQEAGEAKDEDQGEFDSFSESQIEYQPQPYKTGNFKTATKKKSYNDGIQKSFVDEEVGSV